MIKKILLSLFVLCIVVVAGLYVFITTVPNSEPKFVSAEDFTNSQAEAQVNFNCEKGEGFDYAYEVNVNVTSEVNQQLAYQSQLQFKTQIEKSNGDIIKGVATDILVNEGDGVKGIGNLFYLGRVDQAGKYVVFSAYDDLGLVRQHPMAIMGQVLKALSIGEEGKRYHYAYDQLSRTYEYKEGDAGLERAGYPTTASPSQFVNTFNDYKSAWTVELGDNCVPKKVSSVERQGIAIGKLGGFIKFEISAVQIPKYTQVDDKDIQDLANADLAWEVKEVHDSRLQKEIVSEDEMWSVLQGFPESKNTAQLTKAANFMIDNLQAIDLINSLQDESVADAVKRDLIFGLGISGNDNAEQFMIDAFNTFPSEGDTYDDINKVRLLLAMSTNDDISQASFDQFESIVQEGTQSQNVINNALINMATAVQGVEDKGGDNSAYESTLTDLIGSELENGNESTALAAINNANIDDYDDQVIELLNSSDQKVRKRAVEHLAEDSRYNGTLISHIAGESSALVVNSFCVSVSKESLSASQQSDLQIIAEGSTGDKQTLLNKLLSSL